MKILFAFENPLPNPQADAEVFTATARHLSGFATQAWFHVPCGGAGSRAEAAAVVGMPVVRAWAPLRPAALRHLLCGLTLPFRRVFREADLVYTRNLWVAWMALLAGQRVVFDHYRPWPDQIPPLRPWIRAIFCNPRFLANISHSRYTLSKYLQLQVPAAKLHCVHNGFDPTRLGEHLAPGVAKRQIGVDPAARTVVYTGRINHKKGLDLAIAAARRLPDHLFILVGSGGHGSVESLADGLANLRIVPWQDSAGLARYIFAADVLLVPPSVKPLAQFGSTVVPLKLYLYLGAGRPILAGDTPDIGEILEHGRNALLCTPDSVDALVTGITALTGDPSLSRRLSAAALRDSAGFTWESRAHRIAAIVGKALQSEPVPCADWGRALNRDWLRQSRRWLMHLIRKGSWVLPPAALLPDAQGGAGSRQPGT